MATSGISAYEDIYLYGEIEFCIIYIMNIYIPKSNFSLLYKYLSEVRDVNSHCDFRILRKNRIANAMRQIRIRTEILKSRRIRIAFEKMIRSVL